MTAENTEKDWVEPDITINGIACSKAQSLTLRVALQGFLSDVFENGLGDDDHGRAMRRNYLERGKEINDKMRSTPPAHHEESDVEQQASAWRAVWALIITLPVYRDQRVAMEPTGKRAVLTAIKLLNSQNHTIDPLTWRRE